MRGFQHKKGISVTRKNRKSGFPDFLRSIPEEGKAKKPFPDARAMALS
jgi:hypothetical protein